MKAERRLQPFDARGPWLTFRFDWCDANGRRRKATVPASAGCRTHEQAAAWIATFMARQREAVGVDEDGAE